MINIKPLNNYVVLKRAKAEEQVGGIYVPDQAQSQPNEGIVLAKGPGLYDDKIHQRVPIEVEEGDTVLFAMYSGTPIELEGEEVLIVREQDIYGVVNRPEPIPSELRVPRPRVRPGSGVERS